MVRSLVLSVVFLVATCQFVVSQEIDSRKLAIEIYDRNAEAIAEFYAESEVSGTFETVVFTWAERCSTAGGPLRRWLDRRRQDDQSPLPEGGSNRDLRKRRLDRIDDLLERRKEIKVEKIKKRGALLRSAAWLVAAVGLVLFLTQRD